MTYRTRKHSTKALVQRVLVACTIRSRASPKKEDRANRKDETKHGCRNQQRTKLGVVAALDDESLV